MKKDKFSPPHQQPGESLPQKPLPEPPSESNGESVKWSSERLTEVLKQSSSIVAKDLLARKNQIDESRERLYEIFRDMADAYQTGPRKHAWQRYHDAMMQHSAEIIAYGGGPALKEFIQCAVIIRERLMVEPDGQDQQQALGLSGLAAMLNREGEVQ